MQAEASQGARLERKDGSRETHTRDSRLLEKACTLVLDRRDFVSTLDRFAKIYLLLSGRMRHER